MAPNTGTQRRTAVVTVKSGTATATVLIVQDTTRTVSLSKSTWAPTRDGATTTLTITAPNQATWAAVSSDDWLIALPSTGVDGDQVTLLARPNTTGASRTGTLTIHSAGTTTTLTTTQPG
jgi:hypothetical protein